MIMLRDIVIEYVHGDTSTKIRHTGKVSRKDFRHLSIESLPQSREKPEKTSSQWRANARVAGSGTCFRGWWGCRQVRYVILCWVYFLPVNESIAF